MVKKFKFDASGNFEVTDTEKKLVNAVMVDVGASWSMTKEQAIKHQVMFDADMPADEKKTMNDFKDAKK